MQPARAQALHLMQPRFQNRLPHRTGGRSSKSTIHDTTPMAENDT